MRVFTGIAAATLGCTAMMASLASPAGATPSSGDSSGSAMGGGGFPSGHVRLDGKQAVPGPGHRKASGSFRYVVKKDTLCYTLSVRRTTRSARAHIHFGAKGKAGPVAVALKTPSVREPVRDCIRARHSQTHENAAHVLTHWELHALVADPWLFYVNVQDHNRHKRPSAGSAIRGNLG
jgi:hypothetical protein